MSDAIVQVSDASFEQDVLKASGPVLVDFWAEWCGPCKMIAPVLEDLAEEFANPDTAPAYGVRGIPTLIIFKDGEVAGTKVGALSRTQLAEFINSVV
jgi:thioredoxin 1